MDKLNQLKQIAIFCEVIDCGTMRAAAKKLEMTPPAVSQHLNQLERKLGVTLIYRSTRKISLSEAGRQYYQHGKKMLLAAKDANDAINEIKHTLDGNIRISAPVGLAARPLAQALKNILLKTPGLQVSILASDQPIDLVKEQIDIAIRAGEAESSNFIFHPLGETARHIYASPDYLSQYGNPVKPDDLERHYWLGLMDHDDFSSIKLVHSSADNYHYQPGYKLQFNDLNSLISHVEEGLGLAVLPELEIQHLLKSGALIQLMPGWQLGPVPVYALTIDRKQSYKVKAVLDALKIFFSE